MQDPTVPDKTACLDAWVEALGITGQQCNSNNDCEAADDPDICGPLTMPIFGSGDDTVTFDNGAIDAVLDKTIFKGPSWDNFTKVKEMTAPRGDKVKYELKLDMTVAPDLGERIRKINVRFYDYTVPTDSSGWLWNREGVQAEGWIPYKSGQYYKKAFNSESPLVQSLNNGQDVTVQLRYFLDTALAIQADEAEVKNMAFAVVEYYYIDGQRQYIIVGEDGYGNLCEITDLDNANNGYYYTVVSEELGGTTGVGYGDIATVGSTATIDIVRPHVQVTGGGNLAVEIKDNQEKLFSDITQESVSGQIVENPDSSQGSFETQDELSLMKANATFESDDAYFGRYWKTTADKNGIYFYDGDIESNEDREDRQLILDIQDGLAFSPAKTFIIENTDVVIRSNIELLGDFAAFIIRGGNLIIEKDVEVMEGIYVVEDGKIIAQDTSEKQLFVSGALIGNARELFLNRRYIGDVEANGEVSPAVKVNFDLRLLEGTPPGVQGVLGENWGQAK